MEAPALARELGVTGNRLRTWLRRTYPRHPVQHGQRWVLDADVVAAARRHFA